MKLESALSFELRDGTLISEIEDKHIQKFELDDNIHDEETIVGTFYKNSGSINAININKQYNHLKGKEIKIQGHGTWYVQDIVSAQEDIEAKIELFDLSYRFDEEYESMQEIFPCTFLEWAKAICIKVGLYLETTSFPNSNFLLQVEPFLNSNETYRDAIKMIAQSACSFVKIENNKVHIRWFDEKVIELEDWFTLNQSDETKAVNLVVIGRGDTEDNIRYPNVLPQDPFEFKISENQAIYFDREETIIPIYEQIEGFKFYPLKMETLGNLKLKAGTKIKYIDIDGEEIETYIFNHKIVYNGGFYELDSSYTSYIENREIKETSTKYEFAGTIEKRVENTEIAVDKANQKINLVVEEQTEQSKKITNVEMNLNGITQKVENIQDLTNETEGNKIISLENCVHGNLLELRIVGNNSVFDYLYPANDLYPANNLFPYRRFKSSCDK